ncbi:MAG: ABC transporter permease subunit [Oscillospiraceae bacterium]|nr:ABC transporter permease subunit [Oscillospiraceae bacterium]
MAKNKMSGSVKASRITMDIIVHIFLTIVAIVWVMPFVYLIAQALRGGNNNGVDSSVFFPTSYSFQHFIRLFTDTSVVNFPRMFWNTFKIAAVSCVLGTFLVLAVSYCLSRVKWKLRRPYMNMGMVITLFPGFMSMTATYFLLKAMGLTTGENIPLALIICNISGAGVGFHVMKGYMDTIPKALDEAAYLDGATKWQTFIKITLPLCKPMIVYQIITSFMGPWCDFIFAKLICRDEKDFYTVSIGLWDMLKMDSISTYFTRFCAGAVVIAIPISILYIITQRFYQEAMSGSVKG